MARQALEYPWPFRILRTLFPLLESFAPGLAKGIAVRLFLTPISFPMRPADREAALSFEQKRRRIGDHDVVVYGKGEGPEVLCLHGWSGQSMQFRVLANRLMEEGFRCVLIDAPGHGMNKSKKTNLFEFAEVFRAVWSELDRPLAAVGHSLGAASISYAISEGEEVAAFATFGAPVLSQDILDEYMRRINGTDRTIQAIRDRTVEEFGRSFESVTMEETFKSVKCPVFGVHGLNDRDVPVRHLEVLKSIHPNMESHTYEGIGHRRILKDERVLDDFVFWLKGLTEG